MPSASTSATSLTNNICIYIGFSCTSATPPPPCTAVLFSWPFFLVLAGGRPSFSPESHLQKIGFLKVPVPGRASPLLASLVRARWRLCACCCLLLSPVRSSLSHCDAVPPPMAVTYRRTTVRRAFRYLSIIVKTNYGGGVVGGLH